MNGPKTTRRQISRICSDLTRCFRLWNWCFAWWSWEKNRFQGGGFKDFWFSPLLGEDSHFDSYFSDGLKPPIRFLRWDDEILLDIFVTTVVWIHPGWILVTCWCSTLEASFGKIVFDEVQVWSKVFATDMCYIQFVQRRWIKRKNETSLRDPDVFYVDGCLRRFMCSFPTSKLKK